MRRLTSVATATIALLLLSTASALAATSGDPYVSAMPDANALTTIGAGPWYSDITAFNTGLEPGSTADPQVSRNYYATNDEVQVSYSGFASATAASAAMASRVAAAKSASAYGRKWSVATVQLGSSGRMYPDTIGALGKALPACAIRWVVGSAMGVVRVYNPSNDPAACVIADTRVTAAYALAQTLSAQEGAANAGTLPAPALDATWQSLLPTVSGATPLGTDVQPVEAWGAAASGGLWNAATRKTFALETKNLKDKGATQIGGRSYAYGRSSLATITVPFTAAASAAKWATYLTVGNPPQVKTVSVPIAGADQVAAIAVRADMAVHQNPDAGWSFWELRVAKGASALDLSCAMPFVSSAIPKACIASAKTAAAAWVAAH